MMQAETDVTPFLHDPLEVQSAIGSGDLGSKVLLTGIYILYKMKIHG